MTQIIADECIAVSNDIYRELPRSSKKHIIHNGVNSLHFLKNNTSKFLVNRYNLHAHTRIIGNIGQIIPWKNQMDYLKVALSLVCEHKNLHFFVIGAVVDNDYFNLLKQQIQTWGLEQDVTFTGHVENIIDYLSDFELILHTARNEPFGRVLIEAAAAAKPVVAYASGGASEIIENGKTGFLVKDGDIKTMTELTSKLLNNADLKTKMGLSARQHIASHFNSEDYARKVYQILSHD